MTSYTISKKLVVNLGNYESLAIEASVTDDSTTPDQLRDMVDAVLYQEALEASDITEVKTSFIHTWLHSRKDMDYAHSED